MSEQKHIMLIEDNEVLVNVWSAQFEAAGYKVTYSHDGGEGLEIVKQICPDLVILDVMLPGMDGLSVIRELRKPGVIKYPDGVSKELAIIVVTAKSSEMEDIFLMEGATDFVLKPVSTADLMQSVKSALEASPGAQ